MTERISSQTVLQEPPPATIALGRIVRVVALMLEREMNQVLEEALEAGSNGPAETRYEPARQALTIMLLCRDLAEETQRYESENRWTENNDDEPIF
jgi:hypothetical protein